MKKKVKKSQSKLSQIYKDSFVGIKEAKNYILFITGLMFLSVIIGYLFPIFFVDAIQKILKEMIEKFIGLSTGQTIIMIFWNNLGAGFLSIALGIIFGIFPIASAIINGYLIGYVMNLAVSQGGILTLWRLFPHGIFEIPAILISMGIGLQLGVNIISKKEIFKKKLSTAIKIFISIVVPLLVIAGIIEGLLIGLSA